MRILPVLGNDTHVMVLWLVPSEADASHFDLPPHHDTSLYRDLLGDWRTYRPLLSTTAVVYSTGGLLGKRKKKKKQKGGRGFGSGGGVATLLFDWLR